MKNLLNLGLGFAVAAALATASPIGTLTPGSSPTVPNAAVTAPTATLVGSTGLHAYTFTPPVPGATADIAGTYSESVFADTSNPFASGDDTFVLTFTVGAPYGGVERATIGGFAGLSVVADYASPSVAGTAPTSVAESPAGVVSYNFAAISQADTETLVIYTNYAGPVTMGSGLSLQNQYGINGVGLTPGPEPMSMSLLGGGLALLGALRLRTKKRS